MTAKEEDILASQNLIRKGVVLDKLFESIVVSKDVNIGDILIGDKNNDSFANSYFRIWTRISSTSYR